MTVSVVLAVQETQASRALQGLLEGETQVTVRAVATTREALVAMVLDHEPDAVVLHEDFGPAPPLITTSDLVDRLPWISVLLLTREPTLDLAARAAQAGARGLVSWPTTLTDLLGPLHAAARLSRAIRNGSEARLDGDESGSLIALAGAKGGVGTTTLATQLAFLGASSPDRRVCLVDLDYFGGDLAGYFGCGAPRTILDLQDVSDELSPGVVQPLLYPHESGVRVLFGPTGIADGELVKESLVRRTIGILRTMFDAVLVDVGARVTEASLPAVELADRVVVVVTPDLMALRHAHRLVECWDQLDVRRLADVELVVNRVSRGTAVQPGMMAQVSAMPICRVGVPATFSVMERLANEGASGLRTARSVARPLQDLAVLLGLVPPPRRRFAPLWKRGAGAGQSADAATHGRPAPAVAGRGVARVGPDGSA